jgi:hypothetical protein
MTRHLENYSNHEIHQLLPGLLRSAADPRTDAIGRTWIFDALRHLTGRNLADDVASWTAWYASAYGSSLAAHRPHNNLEELMDACPWLPDGASF